LILLRNYLKLLEIIKGVSSNKSMNDEGKELITFSEAARLRGVKPQTIDDYVKRGRLNIVLKGDKKFLDKNEVENLEVGKCGRPSKTTDFTILKKLDRAIGAFKNPVAYYPNYFKFLLQIRKNPSTLEGIPVLWNSPMWRKNRKILRDSLKNYEKTWKTDVCCDEIFVTSQYKNPLIQEFFTYSLSSEKMYNKRFSVRDLKHDFLLYCESSIGLNINKTYKLDKDTERILSLFQEGIEQNLNPFESAFRVFSILSSGIEFTKIEKPKFFYKILRKLYDHNKISTKSPRTVTNEIKKTRQVQSKI
jgi:hypothetical protein